MPRSILDESQIDAMIRERIAKHHEATLAEVQAAVASSVVVVVGMRWNPFPKRARKALDAAGIPHRYLEYGSYFSDWRPRTALKMWTGWPTFPMVFVKGTLVGGASELQALIDNGQLARMLA